MGAAEEHKSHVFTNLHKLKILAAGTCRPSVLRGAFSPLHMAKHFPLIPLPLDRVHLLNTLEFL